MKIILLFILVLFTNENLSALPTQIISNSIYECGGGWNANYLFYRDKTGNQILTNFNTELAQLNKYIKNQKLLIKKTQAQLKKAKKSQKLKFTKLIKKYTADLNFVIKVQSGIISCSTGQIVSSRVSGGVQLVSTFGFLTSVGNGQVFASDGKYLGNFSTISTDINSIANMFGSYGNKFSQNSIFNSFAQYGGTFSFKSPFNKFSQNPPIIYVGFSPVAYLSANEFILGYRVDPYEYANYIGRLADTP